MSRGRFLTDAEIEYATHLRVVVGLRWRDIGRRLGRDGSGLCRACENVVPSHPTPATRGRKGLWHTVQSRFPYNSPLHPRNRAMTGI